MTAQLCAVVLDVDGTLVDSERDGHRVAFNDAFAELGLPYRWDPARYGELLEITGGERRLACYLEREGVPEPERGELARRLHQIKTTRFQALIEEGRIEPRPGVPELLDELRTEHVRLGVATTGTRAWVLPLLDRLFGLDRFEAIVTGDEAPVRKPDPAAHLLALRQMGLEPGVDVLALEDSRNGLVAARAAGLACVVVVNDYTRSQELSEAALVLDGFGGDEPAAVRHDPLDLGPLNRLDVETLRRVVERAASAGD